jgi:hypothetical protein
MHGFCAFILPLTQIFTPPNHLSVKQYKAVFNDIIHKELMKKCYIGLLTASKIQQTLGHFQSSPLSLIPKPGWPGKYRLIQDFSHTDALHKHMYVFRQLHSPLQYLSHSSFTPALSPTGLRRCGERCSQSISYHPHTSIIVEWISSPLIRYTLCCKHSITICGHIWQPGKCGYGHHVLHRHWSYPTITAETSFQL